MSRKYLRLSVVIVIGITSSLCQTEPRKNGEDKSGIFDEIDAGDVAAVERILDANPQVVHQPFSQDNPGTPLHYASYVGNLPIVKLLVNRGGDVNEVVMSMCTVLQDELLWQRQRKRVDMTLEDFCYPTALA